MVFDELKFTALAFLSKNIGGHLTLYLHQSIMASTVYNNVACVNWKLSVLNFFEAVTLYLVGTKHFNPLYRLGTIYKQKFSYKLLVYFIPEF